MRLESAGRDFRLFWGLIFASMSWAVFCPCRSDKTIHGCLSHHSRSYPKLTMDSRPWLRCSFFDHIRTKNASLSALFIFRFDDNSFVVEIDKDAVEDRSLRVDMAMFQLLGNLIFWFAGGITTCSSPPTEASEPAGSMSCQVNRPSSESFRTDTHIQTSAAARCWLKLDDLPDSEQGM